jgi:voltage-dependent potassium channel beta subunit
MHYRHLGRSGLQLSELSFGSWVTFGNQVDTGAARELLAAAFDAGINFFDNAEIYARGESERIMGEAMRQLGWPRTKVVVSTKFYWGLAEGPNQKNTLNAKYLRHAIEGSLARMGLDYIDLVFCHRPDPHTPIEETVWAMHRMIDRGQALYWGTSEWPAADIRAACEIAARHHLAGPVMEQPQYNLFTRRRVEHEYARLYEDFGLGLTTWSPLASGLLTGKYRDGVPTGSRGTVETYAFLRERLTDAKRNAIVAALQPIAQQLGASSAQLAIAWCLKNPRVSTVITGATRIEQLRENLKAAEVAARLTADDLLRIEAIVGSAAD